MAKLYPPIIEGTIPAFSKNGDGNVEIYIPLRLNRAVGLVDISDVSLIIKSTTTGKEIGIVRAGKGPSFDTNANVYKIVFEIGTKRENEEEENKKQEALKEKLSIGQYYKLQIAFVDKNNEVGYYSSIGISKYTTKPTLELPEEQLDGHHREYVGIYSQSGEGQDKTEKIYSYCFTISDQAGNVIDTSGVQLHNSSTDTESSKSTDTWYSSKTLEQGAQYRLAYEITTMNGLKSDRTETIDVKPAYTPGLPFRLIVEANQDEGCNEIYFRPIEPTNPTISSVVSGSFVVSRASDKDDYTEWLELYRFSYNGYTMVPREDKTSFDFGVNDILVWEDFTTEQGVSYRYSVQQYSGNGMYSDRMLNTIEEIVSIEPYSEVINTIFTTDGAEVYVDFEDMFLFDGERQLKLRFNPKVSSFKTTLLEQKVNTLGGKYPFIFRNGNVEFKEFPVSGLLSMISDRASKFMDGVQKLYYVPRSLAAADQGRLSTRAQEEIFSGSDTNLTGDNIYRERTFKLFALDWLNDGKPKLFRSPGEGNYIVRLMNTSLSPNDTLGRMLHTVSCQATEIADYTFDNLNKYGFIKVPFGKNEHFKIAQIQPGDGNQTKSSNISFEYPAYYLNITDAKEGVRLKLQFQNRTELVPIEIGATNSYYVQVDDPIVSIVLDNGNGSLFTWADCGKITYCYYDNSIEDGFGIVHEVTSAEEIRQFIGTGKDHSIIGDGYEVSNETIITDIRRQLGRVTLLKLEQRPMIDIYDAGNEVYYNRPDSNVDRTMGIDWNEHCIYRIFEYTGKRAGEGEEQPTPLRYSQLNEDGKLEEIKDLDYFVCLNGQEIDLEGNSANHGRIVLTNLSNVTDLRIGTGVMCEMYYYIKELYYEVEYRDTSALKTARDRWIDKKDKEPNEKVQELYESYYSLLIAALKEEVEEGIANVQ